MAQDSSKPEFWDTRFRGGVTPWDAGSVPSALGIWLKKKTSSLRVLIPGCFSLQEKPFDVIYERAFLCALPRSLWTGWARRTAELVRPGGELAGFFYLDDNERGPPFGIARQELNSLLQGEFRLIEDLAIPAGESLPVFKGKEVWQVWGRRL